MVNGIYSPPVKLEGMNKKNRFSQAVFFVRIQPFEPSIMKKAKSMFY
jgi:hypothetical protein